MVTAFALFALTAWLAVCGLVFIIMRMREAAAELAERNRLYDEKRARRAHYERLAGLNR